MVKIFVSYSHQDEDVWKQLHKHLTSMVRNGIIEIWVDRKICPGQPINHEIEKNIADADIVLLLVSANFISSDYCYDVEMNSAMDLHKTRSLQVIPVILSACDWKTTKFGNLLAVPTDGKPISNWKIPDNAFLDIVEGLKVAVEKLKRKASDRSHTPNNLSPRDRAILQPRLRMRTRPHGFENDSLTINGTAQRYNMKGNILEKLISLSRLPAINRNDWLGNAADGIDFLKKSSTSGETVLYAIGPHMFIHSVLAPNDALDPPDHADIDGGHILPSHSWTINTVIEEGKDHRINLSPPISQHSCHSLDGGEKLVFVRSFDEVREYEPPIELSQKLIHALDLHYLDERNAYCRLDERGDMENVITVYHDRTGDPWQDVRAVTIRPRELATYMALTATSLVTFFNFTRYSPDEFDGWPAKCSNEFMSRNIFCRHGRVDQYASYQKGHIIFYTERTPADLMEEKKAQDDKSNRQYATFLIIDSKNGGKVIETSCSPDHIVNYFTKSNLPWEMSPAFFHPEVLQKYKSDPEKYTMDRSGINCRGAWYLRSYDINEAGQVHAYIGDIASLPYREQLYWKSFNVYPQAGISERALQTDFRGQFPTTIDHLENLKNIVVELDKRPPKWWKLRGEILISSVYGPATDSVSEWGNEIIALDQLVVEGFQVKSLRRIIESNGGEFKKEWGSLKLIDVSLVLMGKASAQAKDTVAPLKELHKMRNITNAHGDPNGKQLAVKSARKDHGSLRNHFIEMSRRLVVALKEVITTLPK